MWVYGTYVPYDDLRAAVAARFMCLGSGNVVLLILYGGKIFTNVFDADRLKNCGRCVIL